MWVVPMAVFSLVVLGGTIILQATGDPRAAENLNQFQTSAVGGDYGRSSRGVGAPNRTTTRPLPPPRNWGAGRRGGSW
jgi:hypothetical protein